MKEYEKAIEHMKERLRLAVYGGSTAISTEVAYLVLKVLEKQKSGGWIAVSERLPNEEECNKFDMMYANHRKFLCTIKIADYEPQTRELYFSKISGWKYGAEDYNNYVTAWQPLPEPFKEVNGTNLKKISKKARSLKEK